MPETPDPIPPQALPPERASPQGACCDVARLLAAIERLTASVDGLRAAFTVDAPEQPSRHDAGPLTDRDRAGRSAVEFAEQAIATADNGAVVGSAVLDVARAEWQQASARLVADALTSAGFQQVRLPGAGRPRAWVRR